MFKTSSMKAIPLAAALTAAMLLGAAAHAQSGTAATGSASVAGSTDLTPADPNKTGNASTTNKKDNVSPAPAGGVAKDADARTAAKADKKSARASKRAAKCAARKAKAMDGTARSNSDAGPQPVSGLGAVSPSPSK